ncbi:MAG TPA: hypothetical protein VHT29_15300 [Solirubrobacteraceae bacterium]|nr:hypothetical protein [Solirubrobacteraceae bacterium]
MAGECFVLLLEGFEACVEGGDALLEACGVEVAVLEGVLVALDRAFGAADLLGKRAALFTDSGAVCVAAGGGLLDSVSDEPAVAVDRRELRKDRGL